MPLPAGLSALGGGSTNITINVPNYVGDKRELMSVIRTELQRTMARNG